MPDGPEPADASCAVRLGPIRVTVDPAGVRRFAAALGMEPGRAEREVPATYPVVWMTRDPVLGAARDLAGALVPIHLSQSFSYARPLRMGAAYDLSVTLTRTTHAGGAGLETVGTLRDPAGEDVCVLRSALALVAGKGVSR
jgi:hypothetical protein